MPANRLMIFILATAAIITSISKTASAGTIRHDRTDSQYTSLGNSFTSVGSLALRGASSSWSCSGTLIGTNYLLTAAHCLEDAAGQNLRSGTFTLGGTRYTIRSGVKNSGWTSSNRNVTAGYDMAILQLTSNVTNVSAANLFTGTNENGQTGTYVGYGFRGTGTTGQVNNTFGTRRAGQNVMNLGSQLGWSDQVLWSDFTDPRSNSTAQNLEYNIASGDSGGGLFINGLLAGVNSVIQNANNNSLWADYGDRSLVTRVSSLNNWIQNVLKTGLPSSGITTASNPTTTTGSTNFLSAVAESDDSTAVDDLMDVALYDDVYSNAKVPEPSFLFGLFVFVGGFIFNRR